MTIDKVAIAEKELGVIDQMMTDPNFRYWIRYEDVERAPEIAYERFRPGLEACGIGKRKAEKAIKEAAQTVIGDDKATTLTKAELLTWLDGDHKQMNLLLDAILAAVKVLFAAVAPDWSEPARASDWVMPEFDPKKRKGKKA